MTANIEPAIRANWQVPTFETSFWLGAKHPWCIVIPVINEGQRIKDLLTKMVALNLDQLADIIIIDGGSTDGSLEPNSLQLNAVRGLLIKTGPGKLSAQLRCAYAFALDQGYEGIITIDGNNKDEPDAIPKFIEALQQGVDFVQASRFIQGGQALNTPKIRDFAIRFIHAPILSLFSGFRWTDTTQGFRAYSRKMLLDPKIAPFRSIFQTYELLAYLSYRVPQLGYRCVELPTTRRYPKGEIPTKISFFKGNLILLAILLKVCLGKYNPPGSARENRSNA
jgi:dolichol-phosphate mannosyltransferase